MLNRRQLLSGCTAVALAPAIPTARSLPSAPASGVYDVFVRSDGGVVKRLWADNHHRAEKLVKLANGLWESRDGMKLVACVHADGSRFTLWSAKDRTVTVRSVATGEASA